MTIHVHQRDVMNDLATLHRHKRISDANDFEWLKQVSSTCVDKRRHAQIQRDRQSFSSEIVGLCSRYLTGNVSSACSFAMHDARTFAQ